MFSNKVFALTALSLGLSMLTAPFVLADESSTSVKEKIEHAADETRTAIDHGAQKTKQALTTAADNTAHAVRTAADKTSAALKKTGEKIEEKIDGHKDTNAQK
ncbi:MAG TPA: hypothetical protein VGK97_10970 [Spongiibacteraceae bacterium]